MDREISRWILSFIAQEKGINCSVFKSLISVLPLADDGFPLKKFNLLSKILDQIDEDSSITEEMLHWLEDLENLESLAGVASVTASRSNAYRAVAVECTARYLPGSIDKNSRYVDAIERIWRGKIRLMEQAESDKRSRLVTDELLLWRNRLEAALTDESVRSEVLQVNVRTEAFRSLKAYLDEESENLLAIPAKNTSDRGNKGVVLNISPNQSGPPRENLKRNAPFKAARILRSRPNRGVRISDEDELETGTSECTATVTGKKEHPQLTHLVKNIFPDAQGVAELPKSDKHPDPQKVTESPSSDKHEKSSNLEQDVNEAEELVAPKSGYMEEDPLPDQHEGVSGHGKDVNEAEELVAPKSAYMADDPLPDQHEGVSDHGKDVNAAEELGHQSRDSLKNQPSGSRKLPTYNWEKPADRVGQFKAKPNSMPQEKSDPDTNPIAVPIRRPNRRWSSEEEATLRAAVQKFGEGRWKFILDIYPESFEGRTSNDLKDKWRNMTRYTLPRI